MLSFKQYLLIEQDNSSWSPKNPIKLSPLTADAAIKFGELSPEYAPFLDIDQMSDQEIVDTYTKYNKQLKVPGSIMLDDLLSKIDKDTNLDGSPMPSERKIEGKAWTIRNLLARDQAALQNPSKDYFLKKGPESPFSYFGRDALDSLNDATQLKDKPIFSLDDPKGPGLRRIWDAQTGLPGFDKPGYIPQGPKAPDLRGILEPEPLRALVKDSQGRVMPGPILEPKQIEISPEAAEKVKVAIDPDRRSRQVGNQWGNNFLKQLQKNWEKEALQLKLQKENPITQMQDLIKDNDQSIKAPGDLDLDDWSKEYDKFETKLPIDAAKEQQGFSGKDVSTAPRGKQVLGKLTQPLPGSNSPALSTAANVGAGVLGGLVGEYVVEPAAEKAGVFKAVESGTRDALSKSPDWVAKVADPVLGAARFALDPLGSTTEFLTKQARMSLPTTKAERDKATERFERKDY